MLVITRRPAEEFVIEKDNLYLEIVVLEVRGRQVRLGIRAAKDIQVHRKEVYLRNQQAKLEKQEE